MQLRLINFSSSVVVVERLKFATTFWTRFRGLQFRNSLPPDEGLLIAPCRSIHTHWMRFSIDVTMLDRHGVVVQFHPHVRPWRMLAGERSVAIVLETVGGKTTASIGDRLRIQAGDESHAVPATLSHLVMQRGNE